MAGRDLTVCRQLSNRKYEFMTCIKVDVYKNPTQVELWVRCKGTKDAPIAKDAPIEKGVYVNCHKFKPGLQNPHRATDLEYYTFVALCVAMPHEWQPESNGFTEEILQGFFNLIEVAHPGATELAALKDTQDLAWKKHGVNPFDLRGMSNAASSYSGSSAKQIPKYKGFIGRQIKK